MSAACNPARLANFFPLAGLGAEALRQAAAMARLAGYPRGTRVTEWSSADRLVYLLTGELKVDYPDGSMKILVGACDEARFPLARGSATPVGASSITAVELASFDENALDILVTWDQLVPAPDGAAAAEPRCDLHRQALGAFAHLPAAHIDSLLTCLRRRRVKAGEVILRQNEAGDQYFVIERGRALVTREVAGARRELAELDSGDGFGEEALVTDTLRNATVTMKTDGALLCLERADFVRLLREPLLQRIAADEAVRRVAAGARWLDVRFPAECRQNGLPGALNIPLNELRDALPGLPRDREYVVYCQTGRRSSAAAFLLAQRGVPASLLEGGLRSIAAMGRVSA